MLFVFLFCFAVLLSRPQHVVAVRCGKEMSYNIPEAPQAQEQQNFKAQQKAKAQQKEKKLSLCDKKPNKKKEKDVRLKEAMEDARAARDVSEL